MAKRMTGTGESIVSFEDKQFKKYDRKLMWKMNICGGTFIAFIILLACWLVLQYAVEGFKGTLELFSALSIILVSIVVGPAVATIPGTRTVQLYSNGIQLLHGQKRIQGARYDRFIDFGKIKAIEKTRLGSLCFKTAFSSSFLEPCSFLLPSSESDELILSTYEKQSRTRKSPTF